MEIICTSSSVVGWLVVGCWGDEWSADEVCWELGGDEETDRPIMMLAFCLAHKAWLT
jgi:hypothetical protein